MLGERRARKTDQDYDVVRLHVRGGPWGVQLDVEVTPLFCLHCRRQLSHFYYWDGSRYGHAGMVNCDHCGATINCVDSDNIREYLHTYTFVDDRELGKLTLEYPGLYHLQNPVWPALREKTGYSIFDQHMGQAVPLAEVLLEICIVVGFEPWDQDDPVTTGSPITKLPTVVTYWVRLLQDLGLDQVASTET